MLQVSAWACTKSQDILDIVLTVLPFPAADRLGTSRASAPSPVVARMKKHTAPSAPTAAAAAAAAADASATSKIACLSWCPSV